jgi:anti-sigma factor RsiW
MTRSDEFLIQRLLDGELPEEEARALRERMADDPVLRLTASRQRLVTRFFEAGAASRATPPPAFAERVLAAARRPHPVPAEVRLARSLCLAAAFVLGASLLVVLGVVRFGATGVLTAEDRREDERRLVIQMIDELEVPAPAGASAPPRPETEYRAETRVETRRGAGTEPAERGK